MTAVINHSGYTPGLARQLEEREDQLDDLVEIAIRLTPHVWPYLHERYDDIRNIIEDAAGHYRQCLERNPTGHQLTVSIYLQAYIAAVEDEASQQADVGTGGVADEWTRHAKSLEPDLVINGMPPSGVVRRLRCYDPCCIEDPHAEMLLLLHGKEIGGTRYDQQRQWISWGPAGSSDHHLTRADAEAVQLNACQPSIDTAV